MREFDVPFTQDVAVGETPWSTAVHAAQFIRGIVGPNQANPAEGMRIDGV